MSAKPTPKKEPDAAPRRADQARPGWLNDIAQRSTGLPPPNTAPPSQEKSPEKSPWSHAGMGLQFAFTTALFVFMGLYVDSWLHSSPWATIVFTTIGFTGGMYLLIKEALKANASPKDRDASSRPRDAKP